MCTVPILQAASRVGSQKQTRAREIVSLVSTGQDEIQPLVCGSQKTVVQSRATRRLVVTRLYVVQCRYCDAVQRQGYSADTVVRCRDCVAMRSLCCSADIMVQCRDRGTVQILLCSAETVMHCRVVQTLWCSAKTVVPRRDCGVVQLLCQVYRISLQSPSDRESSDFPYNSFCSETHSSQGQRYQSSSKDDYCIKVMSALCSLIPGQDH